MAPTDKKTKIEKFGKEGDLTKTKSGAQGVKKKKKWIPEHKVFKGSVKEGQGFAFKRKQKVKHEYNKLLRKEKKKKNPGSTNLYKEEYPEHLRHLYVAEAERLKKEAWSNRVNRSKLRMKGQVKEMGEGVGEEEDDDDDDDEALQTKAAGEERVSVGSELKDAVSGNQPEPMAASQKGSIPISNRMRKKMERKTSYQKTKEEFERIREKRRKKKEEYLKNKQQREEAIQKYKQKKMETFRMLSKKTKKGQPNLNLQMEYLLQKIQGTGK
ncbi:thyroid transcription factor 1-associated protein 26 homolog [Archocentrus centrarchus]|uniref:thyroid transcription factor 1-associated protein 26 homolog n=1 Tax=Archocentrus centrarchus TaxID=63155 RepID=UPI0011E9DF21|nr:thyroid transcription factor 1-associated protein 26 [Archocentrus centrarchus]